MISRASAPVTGRSSSKLFPDSGITPEFVAALTGVAVEDMVRPWTLSAEDRLTVIAWLILFSKDDPSDTTLRELRNMANGNALQKLFDDYDAEQAQKEIKH